MDPSFTKLLDDMEYRPPPLFSNGHVQSIFPTLFRQLDDSMYQRERLETDDGDFLDLDWARGKTPSKRIVIVSHGLEGHTRRAYVLGMIKAFNGSGWDGLAWNYRSCSGEPNRTLRFYHNGATDDLQRVINRVVESGKYQQIALVGFSLGGNMNLLYLGQQGRNIHPQIIGGVGISVPCDIQSSAQQLDKLSNQIYMKRFIKDLHKKIAAKAAIFPGEINDDGYGKIKNFKDFDDRYTAPIHGFKDALDYWTKCSSKPLLGNIRIPALLVNAQNDPFLAPACFPIKEAKKNEYVHLKITKSGGHVGFVTRNEKNIYWSEKIAIRFLELCCLR